MAWTIPNHLASDVLTDMGLNALRLPGRVEGRAMLGRGQRDSDPNPDWEQVPGTQMALVPVSRAKPRLPGNLCSF